MAGIIKARIDVSKLPKEKFYKGKKGVYYEFIVSVNDETNQYGQNVSISDSQTLEEREAKKPKLYLGNGEVVWTNDMIKLAKKEATQEEPVTNDLPF
tara:strand:- start:841 stop:1131 length:291 start_codon:yes stop_codon:yes gene_type:complete